ncbi:NAD-dependent deacylase [Segetibacter sp. 3557_3]|uniref:SIR2 family NAD-dependent protein deacylase n=1 Tax=Segetibacter sp. 3557_3 TaxID=2547429 RepID=UPI0010588EE5|nr:Sir2 family NAD-dependent protein deacetylase [Segetibacter sp. 3557_3]TDH29154.1 NAD-dependent deacylase [Segetibacter sp. 3557_3]
MSKKRLVVLTGAGVSAESGLKTFRDSGGLWEGYDVYEVASPRGWANNPKLVLDFYNMRRKDVLAARPNAAHVGLADLQHDFDVQIITQNVDDLHERAGSHNVLHLHGEILKMRSVLSETESFDITGDIHLGDVAPDGGQLRPAIVWFEEMVPMIEPAIEIMSTADLFAVVGTSLIVYPAAGLVNYAPPHIPKYIIDKEIPYAQSLENLTAIEQPATTGVRELIRILRNGTR